MSLRFTKMHGLGNDFMVIDGVHQKVQLDTDKIKAWSDRHTGIGFDQCLIVEPSQDSHFDFFYRIFNADGKEVGQCGNGARCLMRFIHHYQLSNKKNLKLHTKTTAMSLKLHQDKQVSVDFGLPNFDPAQIPLRVYKQATLYHLPLENGEQQPIYAVNVGNPHALIVVDNLAMAPVATLGLAISKHPLFPDEANAGFMEILNQDSVNLRVFERGAGETLACGSGAVAAVAIGRLFLNLGPSVSVRLPGGCLTVDWPDIKKSISLKGPAEFVYEGTLCGSLS